MAKVVIWPERKASGVLRATDWAVAACFLRALVILLIAAQSIPAGLVSAALDHFDIASLVTALARGLSPRSPKGFDAPEPRFFSLAISPAVQRRKVGLGIDGTPPNYCPDEKFPWPGSK